MTLSYELFINKLGISYIPKVIRNVILQNVILIRPLEREKEREIVREKKRKRDTVKEKERKREWRERDRERKNNDPF